MKSERSPEGGEVRGQGGAILRVVQMVIQGNGRGTEGRGGEREGKGRGERRGGGDALGELWIK